jgi:hypothetical protein
MTILRTKFIPILIFLISLLIGNTYKGFAQGWTFTFQLAHSGPCGGVALPVLPTFPNFGLPNKAQCESVRQTIVNISASEPVYDDQGHFIGNCKVYFNVSPCTGSDIPLGDQSNSGTISPNGQAEGQPFFTPHSSEAFEDWAKDYKSLLNSYGINSILGDNLEWFKKQHFNPPPPTDSEETKGSSPVPVPPPSPPAKTRTTDNTDDFLNKKPVMFRTDAENKYEAEQDWLRNHPGLGPFAPVPGDGIPYLEEGDFYGNFIHDKEIVGMEQHALFLGIGVAAGLSGAGEVATAVTYSIPVVEESLKAIEQCIGGNCPTTQTIILNMGKGEIPNVLGSAGEAVAGKIGAAASGGIDAIGNSEVWKSNFKFIFDTGNQARESWEALTKKE